MLDRIRPDLYRLRTPVFGRLDRGTNAYLITAGPRPLVIDPGQNDPPARKAFLSDLAELGLDPADLDFFVTHFHTDHFGLVPLVKGPAATVYIGRLEAQRHQTSNWWRDTVDLGLRLGLPQSDVQEILSVFEHFYGDLARRPVELTTVSPGDVLRRGDWEFSVISTPGHTAGHLSLYEPGRRLLFTGDHLLPGISSLVPYLADGRDPLAEYLASLDLTKNLEADLLLPGHGDLHDDPAAATAEVLGKIQARLDNVLEIISEKPRGPIEVARRVDWGAHNMSWDRGPSFFRWLTLVHTLAALTYLEGQGRITNSDDLYSMIAER
jgi:glyoxylase-like metal-dependent hydrolase (beta-lactamase superfamily II)